MSGKISPENYAGARDKRVFARFTADISVKYVNFTSLDATRKKQGDVFNVSAQGVGMFTNEVLGPESRLDIWLKIPNTYKDIFLKGRVIWAKKAEGSKYRVGIKLENPELIGMSVVLKGIDIHTAYRC